MINHPWKKQENTAKITKASRFAWSFFDIKTPIEVLKCLKNTNRKCYLLESVEGGEKWGRYSFLGFDPTLSVKCQTAK